MSNNIEYGKESFEKYCEKTFGIKNVFEKPEAFKGYRVLSCTQYILGPAAASYFAELGAEVIKIELPKAGEPMRHTTPFNEPFLYPLSRWYPDKGTGLGFFGANPNEYFVGLDFHKEEGKEIMRALAAKSDLMVENYRPGTFDRWGIGYRQLKEVNPRLVYLWEGGFGGFGPGRSRASYDILGQSQGGNFSITGQPATMGGHPSKHTIWLADYWGGMMGAIGALGALYWRNTRSGEGQMIEYSQVHGVQRQLEYSLPMWGKFGIVRQRWGNWDTELSIHGIVMCGKSSYPDSDNPQEQEEGFILISAYKDADFARLAELMNRTDLLDDYAGHSARVSPEGQKYLYGEIEKWTVDKTKEETAEILHGHGINCQPVYNSKEVAENPHWQERGAITWIDDPSFGDVLTQGAFVHMSDTPPRIKWAFKPVGADNHYIYQKLLGFDDGKITDYEDKGII
ncbi:MAG: CoA transferase [Epsilonproteobacteria bacterium]|nr:CoA transferase [Campylobacterota bacterium]